MSLPRGSWRWGALGLLGLLAAAGTFLTVVLLLLAVMDPMGRWQAPGISRIEVTQVSRDMEGRITGQVLGTEAGQERAYLFSKEEALALEGEDEAWVLRHYRAEGSRPSHFRLTLGRLALEYPLPWVLLALAGIRALRRRQQAEAMAPVDESQPRKVWKDDFHQRAERFSAPKGPGDDPKL